MLRKKASSGVIARAERKSEVSAVTFVTQNKSHLYIRQDTCRVFNTRRSAGETKQEKRGRMSNMSDSIRVAAEIKPPFTDVDYKEIDALCESLIMACDKMRDDSPSAYARKTASDIIDMIVDLKIDMSEFGDKHAQQLDADGFVTIKLTNALTGASPDEREVHE